MTSATCAASRGGPPGQLTAAVVEKGADGYLTMDRHHSTPSGAARGGELLAAALVVLAAPLGLRFLSSVMATRETLVAVACLAAHFWQNVPKSEPPSHGDLARGPPGQASSSFPSIRRRRSSGGFSHMRRADRLRHVSEVGAACRTTSLGEPVAMIHIRAVSPPTSRRASSTSLASQSGVFEPDRPRGCRAKPRR